MRILLSLEAIKPLVLSFLLALLCFGTAETATFYVGQGVGDSDTNSCSSAQTDADGSRKRNISNANSPTAGVSCLSAGDTLIVKNGTYNERLDIYNKLGTSAAPITIKAQNNLAVTVTGSPNAWVAAFAFGASNGSQYIILDGFVLDAAGLGTGVDVVSIDNGAVGQRTRNITIQNSEIKNGSMSGIILQDFNTGNHIFRNNKIHDNGLTIAGGHGIYDQGHNDLSERNELYNNGGFGLQIQNANDVIARYNISRNNGLSTAPSSPGGGLVVSHGTNRATVHNNLIYDNISTTNSSLYGLFVLSDAATAKIYNNTFHGNGNGTGNYTGALVCQKTTTTTATFENNIVFNNNGRDIIDDPAGPCGASLTLITNQTTDPSFVNATAKNFNLNTGSTAINSGTAIAGFPYNGIAPDIGAFDLPRFSSGQVQQSTPNIVNLTWNNQVLNSSPMAGCTLANFVVNVAGVARTSTACAISGNQVNLTFDGVAVTGGQAVTIAYTVGTMRNSLLIGNKIDNTGNATPLSFTAQAVVNQVGGATPAWLTQQPGAGMSSAGQSGRK